MRIFARMAAPVLPADSNLGLTASTDLILVWTDTPVLLLPSGSYALIALSATDATGALLLEPTIYNVGPDDAAPWAVDEQHFESSAPAERTGSGVCQCLDTCSFPSDGECEYRRGDVNQCLDTCSFAGALKASGRVPHVEATAAWATGTARVRMRPTAPTAASDATRLSFRLRRPSHPEDARQITSQVLAWRPTSLATPTHGGTATAALRDGSGSPPRLEPWHYLSLPHHGLVWPNPASACPAFTYYLLGHASPYLALHAASGNLKTLRVNPE